MLAANCFFSGLFRIIKPYYILLQIKLDNEKKILSIRDRGIGMTKEDLVNNLGTIALELQVCIYNFGEFAVMNAASNLVWKILHVS